MQFKRDASTERGRERVKESKKRSRSVGTPHAYRESNNDGSQMSEVVVEAFESHPVTAHTWEQVETDLSNISVPRVNP
jgi:hypothetical protein